jgi:hypothetical protein
VKLSEANDIALALLLGVAAFWLVNFYLRLAGHRLYWLTFWALVIGLPALAIHWFPTPWQMERGANFGVGIPREYGLGALTLVLWSAAMVLELIVFIALKIRDHRRSRSALHNPAQNAAP